MSKLHGNPIPHHDHAEGAAKAGKPQEAQGHTGVQGEVATRKEGEKAAVNEEPGGVIALRGEAALHRSDSMQRSEEGVPFWRGKQKNMPRGQLG